MRPINEMTLTFPARSVNEGFARLAAAAFAAQLDPTMDELGDIKTVISEAVTNCIVHAYPDTPGSVRMRCRIYPDGRFEAAVADSGVGIADIEKAREPMFSTGGAERSGMGFTIMESFADSFTVRSRPGRGTTVRFTKRISPRAKK